MDRQQSALQYIVKSGLEPLAYWANNPPTIAGVVITTASVFSMIYSWLVWEPAQFSPYAGIVVWMALPALFIIGLLLIPFGMIRKRLLAYRQGRVPAVYPPLDFNSPLYRRPVALVVGLSVLNVAIMLTATYRGINYMDSTQFCGLTCHKVMAPEYTAYQNSPHSRVACVGCHIGPGASWFVRSKLSGSYQVFATVFNKYPRPIPYPVENLRPARETCEQCHWPAKFTSDRVAIRQHYAEDEKNTVTSNVLLLKVGGEDPTSGKAIGIHGIHMAAGTTIEYLATDRQRQEIPLVILQRNGQTETFENPDAKLTPQQRNSPRRIMDCVDCHNRPSHNFELPDIAVDRMIAAGRISTSLPFAKKKAVELLKASYNSSDDAVQKIPAAFRDFYRSSYPQVFTARQKEVDASAESVAAIYTRNVFPQMNVQWGSYPNNIGHMASPGCFRCHDGSHKSDKANVINADCGACHNLLATDDPSPKILTEMGIAP